MFNNRAFLEQMAQAKVETHTPKVRRGVADSISEETIPLWKIYPASSSAPVEAIKRDWSGKWLYYARAGSVPNGRVRVFFGGGTKYVTMTPGTYITGDFSGVALISDAGQQASSEYPSGSVYPQASTITHGAYAGNARFVYGDDLNAIYNELASDEFSCDYPNFAVYSPGYNAASFAGAPTSPFSGVDVTKCKAVRAYVSSYSAGGTITSVSFRWWCYSQVVATYRNNAGLGGIGWAPNTEIIPNAIATAGQAIWVLPDFEVGVRVGRVFLEAYLWVDSIGAGGSRQIYLEAA